jgi:DNA helicase-4
MVNGKILDIYQSKAVFCDKKRYLVVAGAGSGKSLTIVGKVDYLINVLNINPKKILCISFTNEAVNSLKNSLESNNILVDVKTFHKLALDMIFNDNLSIVSDAFLSFVVDEYFCSCIYEDNCYNLLLLYLDNNNLSYDYFVLYFRNVVLSFIKRFKALGYSSLYFYNLLYDKKIEFDDKVLLIVIFKIYVLYEEELVSSGKIDFDDMLMLSIRKISNLAYFKYKYVIIDEYQDTSCVKFEFISSLIKKFDVNVMAVGDDFQSIYSFTGCDVKYFLNFKKYFLNSKILKLRYNYRNPKDIVDISRRFILKNRKQIRKRITSLNFIKDSIVIVYSNNVARDVFNIIDQIDNIFILGRNKNDVNVLANSEYFFYDNELFLSNGETKNIRFLTIHAAKGLENDYVILLNVVDDTLGFPNKIIDNNLYKYLTSFSDDFLYSEERRLFYVALTRARKRIYIFTNKFNESCFIKELIRDYKYKLKIIDFEENEFYN